MAYKRISPLPVVEGGTGAQTLTQYGPLVGDATGAIVAITAGATDTALLGNTGANPSFGTVPNAALTNSTITVSPGTGISVSGSPVALGGTVTIAATGVASSITAVSTSPYVVSATDYFLAVNSSSGAIQINLPNAPSTGREFVIKDSTGSAATHNITVTTVGGSVDIDAATTFVMNTAYQSINVIFDGAAYEIY
jgi:hypothetical protein